MKQDTLTTREAALNWWNNDVTTVFASNVYSKKYFHKNWDKVTEKEIEIMYLAENPSLPLLSSEVEMKKLRHDLYNANYRDYENLDYDALFHKGIEIGIWGTYPLLANRVKELEGENEKLREALKEVVYPVGTIACVPVGTKISIQFDVDTIIKFQKLIN